MKRFSICKVILGLGLIATAASCSNDKIKTDASDYENGVISVGSSVGTADGIATRAFADTDHEALKTGTKLRLKVSGKWVGHTPNPAVLYPVGTAAAEVGSSRKNVIGFNAANQFYWDNFGTGDPANTEGRTEGLTVYAVAVDDGTTAAPDPGTGATSWQNFEWTVETAGTNVLTKDLIYSNNIKFVDPTDTRYKYANHSNPIQLDMQHAMSMITVKILADEGFPTTGSGLKGVTTHKFENLPVFKLSSNGYGVTGNDEYAITKGTVNIEEGVITASTAAADKKVVTAMTTKEDDANWTIIQTALVFPGTQLARTQNTDLVGNLTVDGNEYNVSAEKMRAVMTANVNPTDHNSEYTKPGYNYIFKIKVKKSGIEVEASVVKWIDVEAAEQEAKIWFEADVASSSVTAPANRAAVTSNGSSFNLYKSKSTVGTGAFDTWSLASPSTTSTYASASSKWGNSPEIYWQNKDDNSYFRALAEMTNTDETAPAIAAYSTKDLEQYDGTGGTGTDDVLWGTTAAHNATKIGGGTEAYAESGVIKPRTSAVPMMFYHAKSKLTVDLTTDGTADDLTTEWVDLDGATVKITNLYTTATLKMSDGTYTYPASKTSDAISGTATAATDKMSATTTLASSMVIPQGDFADATEVVITLADGTVYKVKLNVCKDSASPNPVIKSWSRGVHYKYTFKLTKQNITVTASLAKWTEVTSTQDVWF